MQEVEHFFTARFGQAPTRTASAPGRVELLGNHTDYNQGLVMALAVDKHISVAASPRADGWIELASTAFPAPARFALDALVKDPACGWADYVKGLLQQLSQRGAQLGGFNAAIHSTVPLGAGLSSSAALLVSTALVVRKLFPYTLTSEGQVRPVTGVEGEALPPMSSQEKMALCRVCQAAENQFVGVNCGLLDYISSLFGRAEHAILIDCQRLSVDWTPLRGDAAVIICHSGVKHALTGGEYNELRRHCESAARTLGVPSLRMASADLLEARRQALTERDYQCASHIIGENQRVTAGHQALCRQDLAQFGRYLFESHASSRDSFKNSCPELDLLVDLARAHPACLGARLTGGGFGGATLNLVHASQADDFQRQVGRQYQERTGRPPQSWVCQVVDGAA
jgi:galactokinase